MRVCGSGATPCHISHTSYLSWLEPSCATGRRPVCSPPNGRAHGLEAGVICRELAHGGVRAAEHYGLLVRHPHDSRGFVDNLDNMKKSEGFLVSTCVGGVKKKGKKKGMQMR